jgi:hypothetical protein
MRQRCPKHPSGATEIGCGRIGRFVFDEQDQRIYPAQSQNCRTGTIFVLNHSASLRIFLFSRFAGQIDPNGIFCDPVNGV